MEESGIDEFNAAINGTASHPLLVIAKFDFNGQNNDEVMLSKLMTMFRKLFYLS